jgi:nucleotide-binding universal stress UspA family protein
VTVAIGWHLDRRVALGAMFDLLVGSISHALLRQSKLPVVMVPVR